MKKTISALIAILLLSVLCLTGCQKQEPVPNTETTSVTGSQNAAQETIDYGQSKRFTEEDLDAAIKVIREEIGMWEGVTLQDIRYAGDETSNEKNLAWMNELESGKNYTQVCEFLTDIVVDENAPQGPWEAGQTYKDYTWFLARTDGGEWNLMTWGYH